MFIKPAAFIILTSMSSINPCISSRVYFFGTRFGALAALIVLEK